MRRERKAGKIKEKEIGMECNARRAQKTICNLEQSPKTINASGKSMEERSIHMLTGSERAIMY